MEGFAGNDIWRTIPPEEKFEIMAQAQAAGTVTAVIMIIICSTIAIGLKLQWLMWGSFLAAPFAYQFSAGKKWRAVRPRVILEYLAARSAARRFAFAAKGKDLTCKFMFRAKAERIFDKADVHEALEAMIDNVKTAEVWVALFGDSIVMMEEKYGGAESRFTRLIDSHLSLQSTSLDNRGEYSSNKELVVKATHKNRDPEIVKLTSRYPAALIVFEKKLQALIENPVKDEAAALEVNDSFGSSSDSGLLIFD